MFNKTILFFLPQEDQVQKRFFFGGGGGTGYFDIILCADGRGGVYKIL